MIQLFMSRSGSSVIVPLRFPASQSAIAEVSCQLPIYRRTSADSTLIPERSLHN